MQDRKIHSLTVALCVSLVAHGLGLSGLAWWYIEHNRETILPPIDRYAVQANQLVREMAAKPPPPPSPPSQSKPKPPPPPAKKLDKPQQHKDDSGEANGTGTANRSTRGQQEMQANAGYEQADLMRDAKEFVDGAFLPASDGSPQGNNAPPQKSPKAGSYVPEFNTEANAQNDPSLKSPAVVVKGPGPLPKLPDAPVVPAAPVASGTKVPVANVPVSQLPTPKPVQKQIRGHQATLSDTESIALAKENSVVFHAGHLEGRKGLKVKTTEVRWHDVSRQDAELLGGVGTVVQARVDADGNVQDVEIVQSSGSPNIDEDCKLAVWNWTLEPEKDKDGHPIDLNWTIAFE